MKEIDEYARCLNEGMFIKLTWIDVLHKNCDDRILMHIIFAALDMDPM